MAISTFRKICVSALVAGGIAGACAMTPEERLAKVVDPTFFKQSAKSEKAEKPSKLGSVSAPLPTEVTLGLTSLKEESAKEFKGFEGKSLVDLIGQPDFVRLDGTAQIWQYRSNACILDLFLYGDAKAQEVKHAELRGGDIGKAPAPGCFAELMRLRVAQRHATRLTTKSSL